MDRPDHEGDKLAPVVLHFGDRLLLVFSYMFFAIEFKNDLHSIKDPDISFRRLHVLPTIKNACLITTLMALRDIHDFFTPRSKTSRRDDLKASDLGFSSSGFLTKRELDDINQFIVHSTSRAANADADVKWNVGELAMKGVSMGLQFLKWVKAKFKTQHHARGWAAADFYAKEVERIIEHLRKFRSRRALLN